MTGVTGMITETGTRIAMSSGDRRYAAFDDALSAVVPS